MRGASRSGRYAKRSIATPRTAQPAIAEKVIRTSSSQIGTTGSVEPPRSWSIPKPMNDTDHEHVAVGEVEELEDPVDERVPKRDQGVDASEGEPVPG